MKWSNEELVFTAKDTIDSLVIALNELRCIDEYQEEYDMINETIESLTEKLEVYEERYNEELNAELEYQNGEYMRSVI